MSVAEPDSPRWVPQTPNFERTDGGGAHMLPSPYERISMTLTVAHLQPIVSLVILILIVPRLLNYIVAIFLIVSGVIGLISSIRVGSGLFFARTAFLSSFLRPRATETTVGPGGAGRLDVLRFARDPLSWPRISGSRCRTSPPQEKP